MAKNATLDARAFKKDLKRIDKFFKGQFADAVLKEYKDNTPRDTGYAKRHTKKRVRNDQITIYADGDYPNYADVLDEGKYPNPPKNPTGKSRGGYSTQAPKGMSEPTLKFARRLWEKFIRRL